MPRWRVIAVHVPRFELQVARSQRPELNGRPLALESAPPRRHVVDRDPEAGARGVTVGQALDRAWAACPDLEVVRVDDEELTRARIQIGDALLRVGPDVRWGGGGTFYLDATGMLLLHGDERAMLERARYVLRDQRFEPSVGGAGSRLASLLAARRRGGMTIVPPGDDASYLADFPLAVLPMTREQLRPLRGAGVRTLGELAALPADGFVARHGSTAWRARRLARGQEVVSWERLPAAAGPSAVVSVDLAAEASANGVAGLERALARACDGVALELQQRSASVRELEITLQGADGSREVLRIPLTPAVDDAAALLRHCRRRITGRRVPRGIALVEVRARAWASTDAFGRAPVPMPTGRELRRALARMRRLAPGASGTSAADRVADRVTEAAAGWGREREFTPAPALSVILPWWNRDGLAPGLAAIPSGVRGIRGLPRRFELIGRLGPFERGGSEVHLLLVSDGTILRAARDPLTRDWRLEGLTR